MLPVFPDLSADSGIEAAPRRQDGVRRFRNSKLANRRECGFAAMRTYLDGDEGILTAPLRRGQDFHAAICDAIRQYMRDGILNIHRAAYRFVRGGNAEYAEVLALLERFQEALGIEFDIDPTAVLYLEETLEREVLLPSGELVVFEGTPDYVDRVSRSRIRIRDWKTQWQPETEAQFRAGPQLKRYAWLVDGDLGSPGTRDFDVEKNFVRYENAHFTGTLTPDDLRAVEIDLITDIEEWIAWEEAADFRATPGAWCTLCGHHATCPVVRRARAAGGEEDLSIPDEERAVELAGEAHAWTSAVRERVERLKRYLGADHARGYVELAGGTYGFGPVEHSEIGAAALRTILADHGFEAGDELFNVDARALKRFLRHAPEDLRIAVEKATRRWQTSQFRFRKHGAPAQLITTPTEESGELFDL